LERRGKNICLDLLAARGLVQKDQERGEKIHAEKLSCLSHPEEGREIWQP